MKCWNCRSRGHVDKDGPKKKQCAKRRSVCIALLLLVRDLFLKLGGGGGGGLPATSTTAPSVKPPSGDSGDRRISPLEAAFSYACVL